jgi:hypothetical protein
MLIFRKCYVMFIGHFAVDFGIKPSVQNSHWEPDFRRHSFLSTMLMLGLNGCSSLIMSLLIESALFICGVWLYHRTTEAVDAKGRWGLMLLLAFLLAIYAGYLLVNCLLARRLERGWGNFSGCWLFGDTGLILIGEQIY